jgi:hypothetical protein
VSSPPFPLPGVASPPADVVTPCHASFPWSQDDLTVFALSSGNALSCRLPSWVKIKVLNPHHSRRSPSPDSPTFTINCYKKVISILTTLPTTQPHLYFTSSLSRAPHHQSSTHRRRSLSSSTHAHHPSRNNTHGDELAESLSLPEQCISIWIHIKRYFEISQHRAGLSTCDAARF